MRSGARMGLGASLAAVLVASSGGAQPRRNPPRTPVPPPPMEFISVTVGAGETCAAVVRRVYRAPTRTDVIHQYNPTVCPPQRRLTAGLVLRLPRRLPSAPRPAPVAFLTVVTNTVRVQTQATAQPRAAQANDPLFRGTRVSTEAQSSAELTFQDETQLRLYESTLVVILGDTSSRVRRTASVRDTTLVNGSLRAFLGSLANGPAAVLAAPVAPVIAVVGRRPPPLRRVPPRRPTFVAINTAGGRAILRDGESQLTIGSGARASTTLTVYRGSGQLRSGAQTVTVPEGFGARAEVGERIAPVHRLPAAPAWVTPPARMVLDPAPTLAGAYGPGVLPPGGVGIPSPAEWHVQVAHDELFTALDHDARVPLAMLELAGELSPGEHFVRVSAIDAEHYEGPFSEVARVLAVSTQLRSTGEPYRETLALPAGVSCTVDGEPAAAGTTTLDRLRPHALRCAPHGDAEHAAEVAFARAVRAPYRASATLVEADALARRGRVRVRLLDQREVAYAEAGLAAQARGGPVTAGDASAADAATGEWMVPVDWLVGATSFSLHLTLAGDEVVDTGDLALPPAPPAPVSPDGFAQRWSIRGEGHYANMLSEYQRNADPNVAGTFMGNAKAITHGLAGSLRVGLDLRRPDVGTHGVVFGFETFVDGVLFPRAEGPPGMATLVGLGARLTASNGAIQPWVSAGAGGVSTGGLLRFGIDLGLGVDFRLSRALTIGPVVRYLHVLETDRDPTTAALAEDARMLQVGVALTLRFPRAR